MDSRLVVPLELIVVLSVSGHRSPGGYCLPAMPSREPSDLSGLEPDGPLKLLWPPLTWSRLSDCLENFLI